MTTKNALRQTYTHSRLLSLLFIGAFLLFGQLANAQLYLNIDSQPGNQDIKVDFTVDSFQNIASFQFALTWDPAEVSFNRLEVDQLPVDFKWGEQDVENGILRLLWFNPSGFGTDLPNGANMFSIYFDALAVGVAQLEVDPVRGSMKTEVMQVQNGNFVEIPLIVNGGDLQLEGSFVGGTVFLDDNDNCLLEMGEDSLTNWRVEFANANRTYVLNTKANGTYGAFIDSGDYVVNVLPPNQLWQTCDSDVALNLPLNQMVTWDFGVSPAEDCPLLTVDITTDRLRRCFFSNYGVQYCNEGTVEAQDAYIEVTLDPFLIPVTATIPYTTNGNVLTFDIGTVGVNECGRFNIEVLVGCDSVALGQTHCTMAHIFPDSLCSGNDPYTGASLEVVGQCNELSGEVEFRIENVGQGDMQESVNYVIIEDVIMYTPVPIQLNSGEMSSPIQLPGNGSTYRLQVPQVTGHPGMDAPSVTVEGCGTNGQGSFSMGFVTQFPQNDADPFISINCTENVGSYDPNDKRGFPGGVGEEHFIEANTELEYIIRFQNTGTDTAFNVLIVDTISSLLDYSSIQLGASSHPYEFEMLDENVIRFAFPNILLPDSSTNLIGSNGFVSFKIQQQPDNAIGTEINNSAAIYFDFNDPIITNETYHTIGEDFILLSSQVVYRPDLQLNVYPNPTTASATFELSDADLGGLTFRLYDGMGRLLRVEEHPGHQFTFFRQQLGAGMYWYTLEQEGQLLGSGKLMIQPAD
ncbi:MAG: T9SS type A sorting domain-containing protein [Bacteroidota bacterium]